jgi:BolA protein
MSGPLEQVITGKLECAFAPAFLDVINESHMHSVPSVSESHFKVVVVSEAFDERRLLERHRAVQEVLAEELAAGLHALSIEALTPAQWSERGGTARPSPKCHGGSKAD